MIEDGVYLIRSTVAGDVVVPNTTQPGGPVLCVRDQGPTSIHIRRYEDESEGHRYRFTPGNFAGPGPLPLGAMSDESPRVCVVPHDAPLDVVAWTIHVKGPPGPEILCQISKRTGFEHEFWAVSEQGGPVMLRGQEGENPLWSLQRVFN